MSDDKKTSPILVAPDGKKAKKSNDRFEVKAGDKSSNKTTDKHSEREFITLLNVSYDTLEDRLTLKVATNQSREFCFWITHRLYKQLSDLFENIEKQVLVNPKVPIANQDDARKFQKQNTLAKQNFNVNYPRQEKLVRMFGDQPLLIDKIEAVFNSEFVQFTVSSSDMQATLPLHQETVTALRHLMDSAANKGDWLNASEQKERTEKRVLN
ncbi:MAG: hypothetical protein ACR2NY_05575 [Alphaproteobacteria bacterium]